MTNITSIFHKDIIPKDGIPQYEMNYTSQIGRGTHDILVYRRGLVPANYQIPEGGRATIPLLPLDGTPNWKTNPRVQTEIQDFIDDCLNEVLQTKKLSMVDGLIYADDHLSKRGSYIYHVLYTTDLSKKLGPVYSYIGERKCIPLPRRERTVVVLAEPVFCGLMAVREPEPEETPRARFGVMLSKDNLFAFEVD